MAINTLDTRGYWAVNGTPIYVPATPCQIDHSNVTASDTGRDESGYMHITWVRRDVRKVYLKYGAMTGTEILFMRNLMQGKVFTFTFLDDTTVKTMRAYVGETKYKSYTYSGEEPIYTDVQINVIEM